MRKVTVFQVLILTVFSSCIFGQNQFFSPQAPGDFDTTFNGTGWAQQSPFLVSNTKSVAIQPDGKILIGGSSRASGGVTDISTLVRYNSNGSLDTTFGINGTVSTSFENANGEINKIVVQPDGKIVAVGSLNFAGPFIIFRYNSDGSLDTGFDTDGIVSSTLCGGGTDLAIQTDGKIVITCLDQTTIGLSKFNLLRFNSSGTIDSTFGTNGKVSSDLTSNDDVASSLAIQPDGKIVAVGASRFQYDFSIVRYNSDGSLDPTFGSAGVVLTRISTGTAGYGGASSVAVQDDGKIVVGGYSIRNNVGFSGGEFAVARYNPNGALDTSFASNGINKTTVLNTENGSDVGNGLVIQADGRIVLAGWATDQSPPIPMSKLGVIRLTTGGNLDSSFGTNGILLTQFGVSNNLGASDAALQSDGKIVVSGTSAGFGVARLIGGSGAVAPTTFPRADFDGDGKSDLSVFRPSDSIWYLNRSTGGFAAVRYGLSTDRIVPGDYDGDHKADLAVWRPNADPNNPDFYVLRSSTNTLQGVSWGLPNDLPFAADFDGDGKDDYGVWRPSSGDFYILFQATGTYRHYQLGVSSDKPVVADYDGDGKADLAVFRPSEGGWYIANSSDNSIRYVNWGLSTDIPVYADYDGDGKDDPAVFRPSNGVWYILKSSGGFSYVNFGTNGDVPVPGDYDGDGKDDQAVYRSGVWYLNRSTAGFIAQTFGLAADKPAPRAYLPE
ncbi:MAG: VCBS repeat-containing protein [Acidobacteria bacterium]|nr:VCBS repeat-containing protein [Acidobacteriota bacterium]